MTNSLNCYHDRVSELRQTRGCGRGAGAHRAEWAAVNQEPSPRLLFLLWARVGLQSFGGGPAVQIYAYAELVQKRDWLTPQGWAEVLGLCQVVPGINLIALAILTGGRLAGRRGMLVSLVGFLLPSFLITVAVAALYARLHSMALVAGAIRGLVMAAAGGNLIMSWRILAPLLETSAKEGRWVLLASILVVGAVALLVMGGRLPIYLVLVGSGALMAVVVGVALRGSPQVRA